MNKKYSSLDEALAGMDKFKEDMEHFDKEITFLEKRLRDKKEMYSFIRHQFLMAEDAAIDFEISAGLEEDDENKEHRLGYDRS